LVLRAIGRGNPREAGRGEKVSPGVREATAAAHDAGCGGVQFGLEAVPLGRFGEVAIQAENVVDGGAALRVALDVGGAVVTVGHDVNVKLPPATWATFADLCDCVGGAVKGSGYGVEKGAHSVPVQAAGVV
jgi:hypothetical protein